MRRACGIGLLLAASVTSCGNRADVWRFETRRPLLPSELAACAPAIQGRTIYFCGGDFLSRRVALTALDADGSVKWQFHLGHGGDRPIVVDSTVVVPSSTEATHRTLHGLDVATGQQRWQTDVGLIRATVVVGSYLYLSHAEGDLRRVSAATGEIVTIPVPRSGRDPWWLAGDGDRLIFGEGTAVWSIAGPGAPPEPAPPLQKHPGRVSHAIIVDDLLLLQSSRANTLTACARSDGRVLWQRRWPRLISDATAAGGLVLINVFGPHRYELEALDLRSGALRWSVNDASWDPPIVAGNMVYAGGRSSIMAIDATSGIVKARASGYAEVISAPVPFEHLLLFGTIDGVLHAIRRPGS